MTSLGDPLRSISSNIQSEPFELTRDLWCTEVLGMLRPPGRSIVEIVAAKAADLSERALHALTHLKDAQTAFDQGRWAETARTCYRGLEELKALTQSIETRYGRHGKGCVVEQIKAVCSLCNVERHGEVPHHDGLEFDRGLAQHVLACAWCIAGLVLQ
jgi:hypothetical protein